MTDRHAKPWVVLQPGNTAIVRPLSTLPGCGRWPGWRWYLTGTATIWRHGGSLRDIAADIRAGARWARHARKWADQ